MTSVDTLKTDVLDSGATMGSDLDEDTSIQADSTILENSPEKLEDDALELTEDKQADDASELVEDTLELSAAKLESQDSKADDGSKSNQSRSPINEDDLLAEEEDLGASDLDEDTNAQPDSVNLDDSAVKINDDDSNVQPDSVTLDDSAEKIEDDDDDDILEITEEKSSRVGNISSRTGRRRDPMDEDEILDDSEDDDPAGDTDLDDENSNRSVNLDDSIQEIDDDDDDDVLEIGDGKVQSKANNGSIRANQSRSPIDEDDIMEIEETDPLGGLIQQDESNELSNVGDSSHSSYDSSESSPEDLNETGNPNSIIVSEVKSLAQLATNSVSNNNTVTVAKEQDKEPTLVIIDTNSILSGRGPVPIQKPTISSSVSIANQLNSMRPLQKSDILLAPPRMQTSTIKIPDDAFLIEAPSFIVPYVFEQAGEKLLKNHLKDLADEIKKEKKEKAASNGEPEPEDEPVPEKKKYEDYFESPVGKLLLNVGMNLVQEFVQVDLLKLQRRKAEKERSKNRMGTVPIQTQQSIISLKNNIEESKENNEVFRFPMKKCKLCNFKTESELVMSTHLETPHMKNYSYRCNFCRHNTKVPHEILYHMQSEHSIKPRLDRAPAIHQCPHCAFEDNSKAKLTRHLIGCTKRFRLEKNLEPPLDWDTPGKLPKMPKNRLLQQGSFNTASAYIAAQQQSQQRNILVQYPTMSSMPTKYVQQGPNRMTLPPLLQAPRAKPLPGLIRTNSRSIHQQHQPNNMNPNLQRNMIMRTASGQQIISSSNIQFTNNQILQQVVSGQMGIGGNPNIPGFLSKLGLVSNSSSQPQTQRSASQQVNRNVNKQNAQPSISITPLPRQSAVPSPAMASQSKPPGKTSFVICEICDGYIKDLDQLRNHMQWIHKVKIHPKMIYNKPPLNCQKCQFRFFTDQGLERHLLGSHGLVTSSMQEAANKGQDNGRCPLCGKVYQWKLLAHVAKDHNVTLKPAHLSYKCTVCTATFGMYKLFESHVYSAHSMNAKRNNNNPGRPANPAPINNRGSQMQVTSRQMPASSTQNSYKPMKINDEITIIPQPLANASPLRSKGSLTITPHSSSPTRRSLRSGGGDEGIEIIEIDESPRGSTNGRKENGEFRGRLPISESTLRKRNLEISVCGTDSDNSDDSFQRGPATKRLRQN